MSGSIGKVIIPVVSTFDASGIAAAKAGMKELESAQGSSGGGAPRAPQAASGGGNQAAMQAEQSAWRNAMQHEGSFLASSQTFSGLESGAAKNRARLADLSPFGKTARVELSQQAAAMAAEHEKAQRTIRGGVLGSRLGVGQAAGGALDQLGLGAMGGAATIGGAAVGMYALSQAAATQAVELRKSAREAGITVDYYGKLGVSSRQAGIGIDETMAGVKKAHQSFESAALNGDVAEGLFLRSLGLTDKQVAAGMDNAETMVQILGGKNISGSAGVNLFGSSAAANAAMKAAQTEGSFFDPTAGGAYAAAKMKQHVGGFVNVLGGAAATQLGALAHGEFNPAAEAERNEEAARKQEADEIRHQAEAERLQATKSRVNQVANPAEKFQAAMQAIDNMNWVGAAGNQGDRMKGLAVNQAKQEQLAAERPYLDVREGAQREWENVGEKNRLGGFADDLQGQRAQIAVEARMNAQLAPVRSNAENLAGQLHTGSEEWDVASEAEYRHRQDVAMGTPRQETPEMTDIARKTGDQLTDYVQNLTASGPQAGAYGVNTVAGASALMGAEYQMDQSQQLKTMVECLLKIAENTKPGERGHMDHSQAQAVRQNLGYRSNDPVSGLFGGHG